MKFRKLKVYTKSQRRTWDYIVVPEIRLQGKWLEKLGFEEGKSIKVLMEQGKLIILANEGEKST